MWQFVWLCINFCLHFPIIFHMKIVSAEFCALFVIRQYYWICSCLFMFYIVITALIYTFFMWHSQAKCILMTADCMCVWLVITVLMKFDRIEVENDSIVLTVPWFAFFYSFLRWIFMWCIMHVFTGHLLQYHSIGLINMWAVSASVYFLY